MGRICMSWHGLVISVQRDAAGFRVVPQQALSAVNNDVSHTGQGNNQVLQVLRSSQGEGESFKKSLSQIELDRPLRAAISYTCGFQSI